MFERGFKAWCENVAAQQRRELGLQPSDPLVPRQLSEHLEVMVRSADEVPGLDAASLRVLLREDSGSWSAVTISAGKRDLVILNPSHSRGRLSSSLMHELSHILLGHEPARVDVAEDGSLLLSTYNRQQEDEANWLAGCLLLPRDALMLIRRQGADLRVAARNYGVSLDMLQYRLRVTGVDYQMQRVARGRT